MLILFVGGGGVAAIIVAIETFASGSANAGYWNPRVVRHKAPQTPYREAALHETKPQGAPLGLRLASGLGVLFGSLTAVVFAPSGYLFALILFERAHGFFGVLTIAVSTSGFAAGVLLVTSARRAVRGEQTSRTVITYLYLHHLLTLLATGGGWVSLGSSEGQLFVFAACALGAAFVLAFDLAPQLRGAPDQNSTGHD